ncbi:MAG TPA: MutL protein [Clostridiales bacterium]|jgi:uncharacterized protein (TIGR01319 family)|nr:MutL protein [Clostridiales bacterium]
MDGFLFIDFGSTFTKLTLVDVNKDRIIATSKSHTTVKENVVNGYERALAELRSKVGGEINIIKRMACSSAAGGLKIIALGLVPELTAEAAKRAALGAGAKVIKTYSFQLNDDEIEEIKNSEANIILLAGGTDGGNRKTILHNAKMIAKHNIKIPIVVGGNKSCTDQIKEIFKDDIEYYITENVMPKLNKLNIEPAREVIREIFMENITHVPGMEEVENRISQVVMPTPAAVLRSAEILAKGTACEPGIGDMMVVDIGGATTDVHSASDGFPTKSSILLKGLEEPFIKRTVEGDLGLRYSAKSLYEGSGSFLLKKYLVGKKYNISYEVENRNSNADMVPENEEGRYFDESLAKVCVDLSVKRHAGSIESVYTPNGMVFYQEGKDLQNLSSIIGTGGVLVNSENPRSILEVGLYKDEEPDSLKPKNPKCLLDKKYILSAMGLLSMIDEDKAVRILKKYVVEV